MVLRVCPLVPANNCTYAQIYRRIFRLCSFPGKAGSGGYSPTSWTMTFLRRGLLSSSTKTICCQVPNKGRPS